MLGATAIRHLAETIFGATAPHPTEVLVLAGDSSLTRFANSTIHQNVFERDAEVRVRVALGSRVGVASTNDLAEQALRRVGETAIELARRQPERPDFPGLPAPRPLAQVQAYAPATAEFTPARRARAVKTVCDLARDAGCQASGAFSTEVAEIAVCSTTGIFAYDARTSASLRTVILGDEEGSGYAERTAIDATLLDPESIAREAVETARRSRQPIVLDPGEYPVVLREYAVAEMLEYLAFMGFSALAVQEGRSFMSGIQVRRAVSPLISIWDDGLDPVGLPWAFDFEGMPKRRVTFFERGVAREVVHDTQTAHREGTQSTGHALPAPNPWGPMPWNLFMGAGDSSREALVAALDRGLLVTRFWYVNVVHPLKTVLTGMTRDGTFLVERGEVARPVKNLRFTQSALDALDRVQAVGAERVLCSADFNASLVPPLLIDRFRFTGVSTE